jgi:hypothetical protein
LRKRFPEAEPMPAFLAFLTKLNDTIIEDIEKNKTLDSLNICLQAAA